MKVSGNEKLFDFNLAIQYFKTFFEIVSDLYKYCKHSTKNF